MDKPLTLEDFADKVGHRFAIEADSHSIAATLTEAQPLNPGRSLDAGRPPFSLVFIAGHPPLPQRIYRMEHDALGVVMIFLVPISRDARGVSYQATFN